MKKQRAIRIGAIVLVAGATAIVMQMQGKSPAPQRVATVVAPPVTVAAPVAEAPIATAPVVIEAPAAAVVEDAVAPEPPAPVAAAPKDCATDMVLIPQPGAMLDLGLLAPCRPDQRVLIRHGGLVVTGQTSASGTLVASIPAMAHPARVELSFADGHSIGQTVDVGDLDRFERFAVQWMADDGFQLHAFADGGHVWGGETAKPSDLGGFVTRIGNPEASQPMLAEVYTWPAGVPAQAVSVVLNIEAEVTAATCGREILGETLQRSGGQVVPQELSIEMPDCDAVGEFVVLPNPVAPERLAAN